jgi:alpha-N-arabinofuranosidase
MKTHKHFFISLLALLHVVKMTTLLAQTPAHLTLQMDQPGVAVSPKLYGLMTEEINYSYDGGLYAELIRNRIFKDNPKSPDHWSLVQDGEAKGTISLDSQQPINEALTVCLKLEVEKGGKRMGIANDGYWGIPVKPSTTYRGCFYAKASSPQSKPLTVGIESADGKTVFATAEVGGITSKWKKYSFVLKTAGDVATTATNRFVVTTEGTGNYWFNFVSLFPPTFNNRPNGNRPDIMELLADMKPSFLRFPGGNYLEGQMFSTRFDWKKTIGNVDKRPGHQGPWSYRSTDGMGLLEFLEWCEDLKMEPLLAVFAGYTLNKDYLEAGPMLQPFVKDALDEIEYVTGDVKTKWGAVRARDGHPEPFNLTYVEIGNEDGFDMSGSYEHRFAQFQKAIKAKYPNLQVISTIGGRDPLGQRVPIDVNTLEIFDEHYYRNASEMESDANHYDNYDRKGPKVFVGEWATREGFPTTNFNAALGDAAWLTGMERNSDIVVMHCYAPLFVNVSPGGMQWKSDLIGYDALTSYGSPAYYVQKMFSNYLGNQVVPMSGENIPTQLQKLTPKDSAARVVPKTIPALFYVTTRDTQTGKVYLKVVNTLSSPQEIAVEIKGASKISSKGTWVVLKAEHPEDTNTITEPRKIVPVITEVKGLGKSFKRTFPPLSISVLQLDAKL